MHLSDQALQYLLGGIAIYLGWVALRLWSRKALNGFQAKRRQKKATQGERKAIGLLQSAGYEILQTQAKALVRLRVNGKAQDYETRADLLVQRHGRRYVAEVKTGGLAPSLTHAPTRRQLLEYSLAYPVTGTLLIDVTAGAIHRVEFPEAKRTNRSTWAPMVAAFLFGVLACHYVTRTGSPITGSGGAPGASPKTAVGD